MPQLDPTYWASQAFWLILIFTLLYLALSKCLFQKLKKVLMIEKIKLKMI